MMRIAPVLRSRAHILRNKSSRISHNKSILQQKLVMSPILFEQISTKSSSTSTGLKRETSITKSAQYQEIVKMIQGLHSPGEVSYYMQQYSGFKGPVFAVIKVGGEVVEDELNVLCASCSLLQGVGLLPLVIHGGGPQMNRELERRGVKPQYVGGHRVTDEDTLAIATRVFKDLNQRVVSSLNQIGAKARGFPEHVFEAEMTRPELGFVGEIMNVNTDGVLEALKNGEIPVLTSLGWSKKLNKSLNINADVAAREISIKLKPMRVVFTSAKGGWIDDITKKLVPTIDINIDYEKLVNRDYTGRQGTLLKLKEIKHLLDNLPRSSAVAITSASSITKELFTHSGGGTLFLRGEPVHRFTSIGAIDKSKVKALLQARPDIAGPRISDDYFKALASTLDAIYVSESYSACAIVTKRKIGEDVFYFLEQFYVEPAARGTGLDNALWSMLRQDYPSLAWKRKNWNDYDAVLAQKGDASLYDHETDTVAIWYARSNPPIPFGIGRWDMEQVKPLLQPQSLPSELVLNYLNASATTSSSGSNSASSNNTTTVAAAAAAAATTAAPITPIVPDQFSSYGPASKPPVIPIISSTAPRIRVGLIGARGYVGREFVNLLIQHPQLELVLASSRALLGKNVCQAFGLPENVAPQSVSKDLLFESIEPKHVHNHPLAPSVDVWVLALPNGLAPEWVAPLKKVGEKANGGTGALMIDLGADFRFNDDWVYGFPERPGTRKKLRGHRQISNPGCYATGMQSALMPLLLKPEHDLSSVGKVAADLSKGLPHTFGVSGYSGAGTTPSDKNNPAVLRDNLLAYTLVSHMHEREVSRHLNTPVAFMPHVASWFQGISLTTSVFLKPLPNGQFPDAEMILEHYTNYYQNEKLIRVTAETPAVRNIMHHHHVVVGGFTVDKKTGRLAMVSIIDNLLKGAATQALQNVNIALALDNELSGIHVASSAPNKSQTSKK